MRTLSGRWWRPSAHDVATLPVAAAGLQDRDVLSRSVGEGRILVTNDKDFADLTFLQRKTSGGVILIQLPRSMSPEKEIRVGEVVEIQGQRLVGAMTVIEKDAIRRRAFPLVPPARPPR